MPSSSRPPLALSLSDSQLDIIRRLAEPLASGDRGAYLQRIAALLRGRVIGDGAVSRAAQMAQAEFRRPAAIDGRAPRPSAGKYAR
jgi:hypothetical protein